MHTGDSQTDRSLSCDTAFQTTAHRDGDALLDHIGCAFAACASSNIRTTTRQILRDLAATCRAECAIILKHDDDQRHCLSSSTSEDDLPLGDWIRRVSENDGDGFFELTDWQKAGATVCAHRFDGHDTLVLRWREKPAENFLQDFSSLTERVGKLIAAAMKRENAAEERRILLRRLSESQKLDVAGTTAVAMAHNLNNVLAAMLGQTEIALDALRNQPRGYNAVMAIRNASERAAELIESILGFGQRDIASTPISMSRLTIETLELLRPAIPERITVTFEDRGDEERVHGRATELQQVILNLLRNGMQAIPDRGRIVLRTAVREGHGRLAMQIGALEERPYLVVEVKDTGVGIDPASHATIFRPFHTTRPAGTGLGLSTVADIVSDHNGAIRIVDPPEGGTTFEVWLPISREVEGRPALENGNGQPVLIVARDTVRERFEDIVAALNYEPEGFASIDSALGAIAYDPLRPCAIMLCTERADLDGCIVMAERFRSLPGALPLTILMPGRMSATPLGRIAGRPMWLAGSENNSAIAACMRLMADAAVFTPQGATK